LTALAACRPSRCRRADREVVAAVAVEVAGSERTAEAVLSLGRAADALPALRPASLAAGDEPAPGTVEDLHDAGVLKPGAALSRDAHSEVGVAVAVEVARDQRRAEAIVALRDVDDTRAGLGELLVVAGAQPAPRAVEHVDGAGGSLTLDGIGGRTDREVGAVISVEVGARR
jgi:hypothetical protein